MRDIDLSIVVINWNTCGLLARCLSSLDLHIVAPDGDLPASRSRRLGIEVLVVDNASADGSVKMVRERFPHVNLIENRENVGFAAANNQAIQASAGRHVLLLNSDTEVRPGALEALVHFMDSSLEAGAAGARLLNEDGSLQVSCYPKPTLLREFWRLAHLDALLSIGTYTMAGWSVDLPRQVDVVQGACLLLRRKALEQVGLLDEDYFMYSEEVDLCHRLRASGWSVCWVPEATVLHHGGGSTSQVAKDMFLHLHRSKVRFFRRRYGVGHALAYKAILLAGSIARLSLSPLAWLEAEPRRRRHLSLASNYLRLVAALPSL